MILKWKILLIVVLFGLLGVALAVIWTVYHDDSSLTCREGSYGGPVAHFLYGWWSDGPMDRASQQTIEKWRDQGFQIKVWDPKQVEERLDGRWLELYKLAKRPVQKCDIARLFVVWLEGGVYFDLDCRPKDGQALAKLLAQAEATVFVENVQPMSYTKTTGQRFPIRGGVNEQQVRLANFSFAASSKHPVFERFLTTMEARLKAAPANLDDYGVLYTTGPDMVTDSLIDRTGLTSLQTIDHRPYMVHSETGTWRSKYSLTEGV